MSAQIQLRIKDGKTFTFTDHDTFIFGRMDDGHARFANDTEVSRHHFILEVNPPQACLRDLGSLNGTWVNGKKFGARKADETPEEGANTLTDEALLPLAGEQGRVLVTHDIRFKAYAEDLQRDDSPFAGLIYGHAEGASIGQYVRDLDLIAKPCEPAELTNAVIHLPL